MDEPSVRIEPLPIRRIAARFIARNEREGLDELDAIASSTFGQIRRKHRLWLLALLILTVILVPLFLAAAIVDQTNPKWGSALYIAVIVDLAALLGTFFGWRFYQYGFGRKLKPMPSIYANADGKLLDGLARFFSVMQLETTPRAYYEAKSGRKVFLDRRYFYGRLRVLMLSEHRWEREPMFSPSGWWFDHEVKMDVDVEALIRAANARPKSAGRPTQYDYKAILLVLTEHPSLDGIDPTKHGSESQVMKLIHKLSENRPDYPECLPEDTQLRGLAKEILAAIKKNRAAKK